MLAALGLQAVEDETDALCGHVEELRQTLLGCAACTRTDLCAGWLDQGQMGVPLFCRAREAFGSLQEANAAQCSAGRAARPERVLEAVNE